MVFGFMDGFFQTRRIAPFLRDKTMGSVSRRGGVIASENGALAACIIDSILHPFSSAVISPSASQVDGSLLVEKTTS